MPWGSPNRSAVSAGSFRLHHPLPSDRCAEAACRAGLGARNQTRWIPAPGPRAGQKGAAVTRSGVDWSDRYPGLSRCGAAPGQACDHGSRVLLCRRGWRYRLRRAAFTAERSQPFAYAFDLLSIEDKDIRPLPLVERRKQLAKILRKAKPGIRLSEHIEADGVKVFDHACKLELESTVSNRVDAPYRSGRAGTWIKVKNRKAPAFTRVQDGTF
jgi:hypothetical protein